RSLFQIRGDVEGERHMPALIMPDLLAVDPDGRFVVYRAEVQQDVAPFPFIGDLEAAGVPGHLIDVLVINSRELGLVGEGNDDLALENVGFLMPAAPKPLIVGVSI